MTRKTSLINFKSMLTKVFIPSCNSHMTIQNALAGKYIRLIDENTAEFTQPYNQIHASVKGAQIVE